MSLSQSSEINLTDNGKLALNAKSLANSAQSAAERAQELANGAQRTADGKNSVYRGTNPNSVPTANLKVGDIYFTDNALYTWNGSSWEETVSDTTGAEIKAKVDQAIADSQKDSADLKENIKATVKQLEDEIAQNKTQVGNALNFYKEQYYQSTSYTELVGGSWSDEVPTKTEGKYIWSRYVTANVGDPTNQQYSDPVCISGLDGAQGPQGPKGDQGIPGPQGPQGVSSYTHIAYATSADGKTGFDVSNSTGKTYIGIYVDSNIEDSTEPTKYAWTLIKGADGADGIPGPKGADGRTPYVHFAYANSADGKTNFNTSYFNDALYVGTYTDYTQTDSNDYTKYTWSRLKGDTGNTGATGAKGDKGDTGFFIGSTPPPNPAVGTVWTTTDSSGNMTSAKTWNGSNWVSTAFTQDLVAGNITASKIVGGELDVNKITIKNAQNIPIESTVSLGKKLSDIKEDADGLKLTVTGGGNLLNNTSDTLQSVSVNGWTFYTTSTDEPIAKHQLDGQKVTLSAWIENPSKDAWVQMWTNTGGVFQGNHIPAGGSGWSQVTYTMPSGFTDWNIVVGSGNNVETTFGYSSLQLEVGPNRTAWSQSTADISALEVTANGLDYYVNKSQGSDVLKALLKVDPNNSVIAQIVNGNPVAAINLSKEGKVQIDGSHISLNGQTTIPDATIKSSMIESLSADKLTAGTIDASQIRVINLDANNITTGTLSARINDLRKFKTYIVSSSNTWDFNNTKSTYDNWFLIGEISTDHVWNGPGITPYMYVTSRGTKEANGSDRYVVTVWKDNDPTQYQRAWNGSSWSKWVMLPNSQNIVSTINLSKEGVKISGKNIELDGNTTVTGRLDLMQKNTNWVNQSTNYHNSWSWNNAHIYFDNYLQLLGENCDVVYSNDKSHLDGGRKFYSIATLTPGYLKFTTYQNKVNTTDENFDGQITRTYIDSGRIETNDLWAGDLRIVGHHIRPANGNFVMVSNRAGTNFDNNGSVGFQVYGGVGLGMNTIYNRSGDLYIQQGNAVQTLHQSYSDAGKVNIHCGKITSQWANTVSSRLSVKTDITKVTYDRALAAVQGTEMYDYRYVSDDSGQHYVSGIIDDINPDPQYHMDGMLINKERTARIDANLIGYHHVIIQKLLERVATLEAKLNNK